MEDMAKIQQMKVALIGSQQKLQIGQQEANKVREAIDKDPDGLKIDVEHAMKRLNEWKKGKDDQGNMVTDFPQDAILPPMVKNWYDALGKGISKTRNVERSTIDKKTGKEIKVTEKVNYNNDPDLAKKDVGDLIMGQPSWQRTLLHEIHNLPVTEQSKWMDKYKSNPKNGLADFMLTKHGDAVFQDQKKYDELRPRKGKGSEDISSVLEEDTSTNSPITGEGLNPKENKEYTDLLKLPTKTKEQKDRIRSLAQKGASGKEYSTFIPHYDQVVINKSASFNLDNNNVFDAETGKKTNESGSTTFNNAILHWYPYNEAQGKFDLGGVDHGSKNSLNPGWKLVPVLVGRDSGGKEMNFKILNKEDIQNVAKTAKIKLKDIPLEKGTKQKDPWGIL
jgi:hypothetical protein